MDSEQAFNAWMEKNYPMFEPIGEDEADTTSRLVRCVASHLFDERQALLEGLQYARRFLRPEDHDTAYVDALIAKATGQ